MDEYKDLADKDLFGWRGWMFDLGAVIMTVRSEHVSDDWTLDAIARRRFGAVGEIIQRDFGHGECYAVKYADGVIGSFDPWELILLTTYLADHPLSKPVR